MRALTFTILAILHIFAPHIAAKVCVVPIGTKKSPFLQWPLVFRTNGELYITNEKFEVVFGLGHQLAVHVNVEDNEKVILSCGPNYLKNFPKQEAMRVRCDGESGNFTRPSDNTKMDIADLTCDLRVIEEIIEPVTGCNNPEWNTARFGYVDPIDKSTYVLGEACYDQKEGRTIFAHFKMGDKDSNYLEKLDKKYLTSGDHPNSSYKIELFRGLRFDKLYAHIKKKLNSQYAPPLRMVNFIDDPFLGSKQFQAIKKLSFNYYVTPDDTLLLDLLKRDIKSLSERLNIDVFIGSHGVMTLHGKNGEKLDVYLHEQKQRFPVPKYIWFIVKHEQKATAFLVSNEPEGIGFLDDDDVELIATNKEKTIECQSACETVTWLSSDIRKRATVHALQCCSYENMKRSISNMQALQLDTKQMLL